MTTTTPVAAPGITAAELRKGNLIYRTFSEDRTVNADIIKYFERDGDTGLYAPILLSPEILEKAGFLAWNDKHFDGKESWHIDAWCVKGNRFDLDYRNGGIYLKSRYEQDDISYQGLPHIKYLHQLMNLFFA